VEYHAHSTGEAAPPPAPPPGPQWGQSYQSSKGA
jgi:ABC-2 type transport system ATP-binding protein